MSDIKKISTTDAFPVAGPYSQAVATPGLIFVSGQIPGTPDGQLVKGSIAEQTRACCDNVAAILKASGSSVERVVKVNVFLDDMANFKEMNGEYEKFFTHKPARSCVAVKALPLGVPVEIECIALPA
ncbi:YjgF-like protein [Trichodelitschia bisporula]|uniref:YjgF-like protein n=1 Tax=Trichodelitschia bisporula TaxID=703511 RepID=A0A6G1I7C6_9PEZI|nr:YjgF-like protein [Trichodelitschia bisporula]